MSICFRLLRGVPVFLGVPVFRGVPLFRGVPVFPVPLEPETWKFHVVIWQTTSKQQDYFSSFNQSDHYFRCHRSCCRRTC